MASGKQHFNASLGIGLVTAPLALINPVGYVTGTFFGIFFTPDADVKGTTYPERLLSNAIKDITGIKANFVHSFVLLFTFVYAYTFKHRSKYSHFPILSTAIRILFIFPIVFVMWWYGSWQDVLIMFGIWVVHDLMHFLMDGGMYYDDDKKGKRKYALGYGSYRFTKFILNLRI